MLFDEVRKVFTEEIIADLNIITISFNPFPTTFLTSKKYFIDDFSRKLLEI